MDIGFVDSCFRESLAVKTQLLNESRQLIFETGQVLAQTVCDGNKILFCGNGGSAADAQHLAAELVVKLRAERRALPGLALTTDTSVLTAASNDFGYEDVFVRQIEAFGQAGDALVANSTSGDSENVLRAVHKANEIGMKTVLLAGSGGGRIAAMAGHAIVSPGSDAQRIQESHLLVGHIWMEMIEAAVSNPL